MAAYVTEENFAKAMEELKEEITEVKTENNQMRDKVLKLELLQQQQTMAVGEQAEATKITTEMLKTASDEHKFANQQLLARIIQQESILKRLIWT